MSFAVEAAGTLPSTHTAKTWRPSYETIYLNLEPNNRTAFLGCEWSVWFMIEFPCLDGGLDVHIYLEHQNLTVGAEKAKSGTVKT